MAADPADREDLHRLIDELPDDSLGHVVWLLRRARDPMLVLLDAAPEDDEPLTAEDVAAIEEARECYRRGEVVSLDELIGEFDEAHG